jgi:hypothetical protein
MGCPNGTAKSRIQRGRYQLRDLLRPLIQPDDCSADVCASFSFPPEQAAPSLDLTLLSRSAQDPIRWH